MKDIYRCANCGEEINHPKQLCPNCGYARSEDTGQTMRFKVVLINAGPNHQRVVVTLNRLLGIPVSDGNQLIQDLPAVILETESQYAVRKLIEKIKQAGGSAEVVYENEGDNEENASYKPLKPKREFSILGKVLPVLLVILAIVGPYISDHKEQVLEYLEMRGFYFVDTSEPFKRVEVMYAKAAFQPGETVVIDKLGIRREKLSEVPETAIAPLYVRNIIGSKVIQPIAVNAVLEFNDLEGMPDDK